MRVIEIILPDPENAMNPILKQLTIMAVKSLENLKSMKLKEQTVDILEILNQKTISIQKLQDICFTSGIPDEIKGLRPLVWMLFLNHLPL